MNGYSFKEAPYGEINSLGSETAPILYQAMKEMINAKGQTFMDHHKKEPK